VELRVSGHGVYRTEYHIVWIPKYRRRILNPGVRWSRGYFVSTVGIDEERIIKYGQWQGRQDSGQAKLVF
jgi:REP element-mobilizing transposase RayT